LLFTIVLAFSTVGLGGVATGVLKGCAMNRIDTGSDRHRFLVGTGYAYDIGHGILLIPIILFFYTIASPILKYLGFPYL